MRLTSLCRNLLAVALFSFAMQLSAQDLPGLEVPDSDAGQDANTLVTLASQQFPDIFSSATPWRSFNGVFYKYFASTGVFLGVGEGDLYLLGGQFGEEVANVGKVSDIIVALGGTPVTSGTAFDDFTSASTLQALLRYFTTLTVSYDTVNPLGSILSSVTLESQGTESVNGASAEKLIVTVEGSNLPESQTYQMWVDSEGVIIKLIQAGTEFGLPNSNLIGSGLVSSMLLSLAAAESPIIEAAINEELASPDVATNIAQTTIGGIPVQTLTIQVGDESTAQVSIDISDFGNFSMASKFESTIANSSSSFELKNIVLR